MPLHTLSDVTQQPDGDAAADRPTSFRERKQQQLQDEPQPEAGRRETLAESAAPDVDDDQYDGYPEDDEGPRGDTDTDEPGALEQLSPADDDAVADDTSDEDDLSEDDLRKKYRALQQEFSRVTHNRKKLEQDFSDGIAENIGYRHQLEDLTMQANKRAELFLGLANQSVEAWEKMDWTQVAPEKMGAMKQRYQKAVQDRNQLLQIFQHSQQEAQQALDVVKKREAEISLNVLRRRIPDWSDEHYGRLREFATTRGFAADEFNEITDWRYIDLINDAYNASQAVTKVQNVKRKNKARVPRNRNGRPQPRNADGRYRQSRDRAFDKPGDKGSFREMKLRQMERERKAGR